MSEQWYYRMFGEEFGPVALEKLREMAAHGTVGCEDEVRSDRSTRWVPAGSVRELGLGSSGGGVEVATASDSDAAMNVVAQGERAGLDDWYCLANGHELGPLNFDELMKFARHEQLSADDEVKLGANGKWRRVGSIGRLMAVLPFRAAEPTKPRPAGRPASNRSMTPAHEQPAVGSSARPDMPPAAEPAPVPAVDMNAAYLAAYEQARTQIAESMIAQAEAAYKKAEETAKAEMAWASAPNVDSQWWGWMGGVEFGPVAFVQVFALAKNGQLKPSDFLRNGPNGQMFPSSNAPGLFSAVAAMAKAAETLSLAKVQAQAAAALTAPAPPLSSLPATAFVTAAVPAKETNRAVPQDVEDAPKPAATSRPIGTGSKPQLTAVTDTPPRNTNTPNTETPVVERPSPAPVSAQRQPSLSSAGSSSSSMSSSSSFNSYRPVVAPARPAPRPSRSSSQSSFSFSEMLEPLKEPKALGAVGVVAAVLLSFGWFYLPKSSAADVKNFRELKHIIDEIKQKRSSNSTDFASVNTKAEKIGKAVIAELAKKASRDEPAKQHLLWAARDRMPAMLGELKKAPTEPSKAEQSFIESLREAARILHIKDDGLPPAPPRPPVDPNAPVSIDD